MANRVSNEQDAMEDIAIMKIEDDTEGEDNERKVVSEESKVEEKKPRVRKYLTKHMKMYPELYRSDVSIHPSYTALKILPYYVVCRHRIKKIRNQIKRQLNREIMHFAMMQMFAIDSVRVDRIFSVGIPPKTLIVPDFASANERRHINKLLHNVAVKIDFHRFLLRSLESMFRNKYQQGLLSVLYSCGSSPLELWDMHVKNGYIRRVTDEEVKSLALELAGTNVTTTYIFCPKDPRKALGIRLPFLIMIVKNMKKYFTFEITILDDKNMHRRFRMSNFQSTTRVRPFCTSMPIGLSGGWNQIQFNLEDFTRRAYGTNYIETTRMQIHANCRIRRIYFADRIYSEDDLAEEFKLFLPIHRKKCVRDMELEKKKKIEADKVEPEEPPSFGSEEGEEGVEGDEEEEEEEEDEPLEDAITEEDVPSEEMQEKVDKLEDEGDEEDVDEPDVADYEAEDEDGIDQEAEVATKQSGFATEEETDVEQEDEEGDEYEEK